MSIFKGQRHRVSKNTAQNPVAKAVAKAALVNAIVDQKIVIYYLTPGKPCASELEGVLFVASVVLAAASAMKLEDPRVNILKGSVSAITQAMELGRWDPINLTSVLQGIDLSSELAKKIKADDLSYWWAKLTHLTNASKLLQSKHDAQPKP